MAHDSWRDVADGMVGAAGIALAFLTPWLRPWRNHWGLSAEEAAVGWPGDDRVAEPDWQWTHAIHIDAPPEVVWPWVAQLGQGRAGFYSYQWLENLAGCDIENADTVHPEWSDPSAGEGLRLHPDMPPMDVVEHEPGRWFLAFAAGHPDPAQAGRGRYATLSWLFLVEPHGSGSRFVSRFRSASSHDLTTRLAFGPLFVEPVGFVMDRRMLLGVQARAEGTRAPPTAPAR